MVFFLQAEDGIRDVAVTGVQTCALPIFQSEIDGLCTQTSVQTFQPLNEPVSRPYKAGLRQMYGANVSGGSDQVTYYLSSSYENEIGPFRLPKAEEDSVRATRGTVPDNQVRP